MRMAPEPRRWISMSPPILKDPDLPASSLALTADLAPALSDYPPRFPVT
jgi:hypothetical protein